MAQDKTLQVTGWPTFPPERIERGEQVSLDEPFGEWAYRMLTDKDRPEEPTPEEKVEQEYWAERWENDEDDDC